MEFTIRLVKLLARDWEEFIHDMTIYLSDYRRENPRTKKIQSVILIVAYLLMSVVTLKARAAMPPPGLPLWLILAVIAIVGLFIRWIIRSGHLLWPKPHVIQQTRRRSTMPIAPQKVMNVRETAAYLHVHSSTLYRLLKRRHIPAFRVGSDWRFNVDQIDKWRLQQTAQTHKQ